MFVTPFFQIIQNDIEHVAHLHIYPHGREPLVCRIANPFDHCSRGTYTHNFLGFRP